VGSYPQLGIITLAGQGLIILLAGIAMMLGAGIGTCADTLVATIGRSRSAIWVGIFHLAFYLLTVALGILFVRQIANAHVAFNVAGALLIIGFVHMAAKILCRIVPDQPQHEAAAPRGSLPETRAAE
jgi:phosphate:Na+ symporter